ASIDRARANGRSAEAQVIAIDVDGLALFERKLASGSLFGAFDVERAMSVCMITTSLARNLFGASSPIGQMIVLRQTPLRILGIVADDQRYANAARPEVGDSEVFVPYSTLLARLDPAAELAIVVRARSPEMLPGVRSQLKQLMELRRGRRSAEF